MSVTDRVRRVVTVLLLAGILLVAPQVAFAGFSTPRTSALDVSTTTLATPSSPRGVFACDEDKKTDLDTIRVTMTSLGGSWPAGSTFVYVITSGGEEYARVTSSSRTQVIAASQPREKGRTEWTLEIRAALGQWTSQAVTTILSCSKTTGGAF